MSADDYCWIPVQIRLKVLAIEVIRVLHHNEYHCVFVNELAITQSRPVGFYMSNETKYIDLLTI